MDALVLAWIFVGDPGVSDDSVRLPDNSLVSTVAGPPEPTDRRMIDEVIDVRIWPAAEPFVDHNKCLQSRELRTQIIR